VGVLEASKWTLASTGQGDHSSHSLHLFIKCPELEKLTFLTGRNVQLCTQRRKEGRLAFPRPKERRKEVQSKAAGSAKALGPCQVQRLRGKNQ
jgi:hypothetical protein